MMAKLVKEGVAPMDTRVKQDKDTQNPLLYVCPPPSLVVFPHVQPFRQKTWAVLAKTAKMPLRL